MLLNIVGTNFQGKTFLTILEGRALVMEIRVFMMHLFYDLGLPSYKFRLRHIRDDVFLSDRETLTTANLIDGDIIEIVSLTTHDESCKGYHSHSHGIHHQAPDGLETLKKATDGELFDPLSKAELALLKEIAILDKRVTMLRHTRLSGWAQLCLSIGCVLSSWSYAAAWGVGTAFCCFYVIPKYSRSSGYVKRAEYKTAHIKLACLLMGSVLLLNAWVVGTHALILTSGSMGCKSSISPIVYGMNVAFQRAKSREECEVCDAQLEWVCHDHGARTLYTFAVFVMLEIVYLITITQMLLLVKNMMFKMGDKIRFALARSQNFDDIFHSNWDRSPSTRLQAAMDISFLVPSLKCQTDILEEGGGVDMLVHLAVCGESPTQEFAVEALSILSRGHYAEHDLTTDLVVVTLAVLVLAQCPRTACHALHGLTNIAQTEEGMQLMQDHGVINELTALGPTESQEAMLQALAACLLAFARHESMVEIMVGTEGMMKYLATMAARARRPGAAKSFLEVIELVLVQNPKMAYGHGSELVTAVLSVGQRSTSREEDDVKHGCMRLLLMLACDPNTSRALFDPDIITRLSSFFMVVVLTSVNVSLLSLVVKVTKILAQTGSDTKIKLAKQNFQVVLDMLLRGEATVDDELRNEVTALRAQIGASVKIQATQMRFET